MRSRVRLVTPFHAESDARTAAAEAEGGPSARHHAVWAAHVAPIGQLGELLRHRVRQVRAPEQPRRMPPAVPPVLLRSMLRSVLPVLPVLPVLLPSMLRVLLLLLLLLERFKWLLAR